MFLKRMRTATAEEVRSRLASSDIIAMDDRANCFGVESLGMMQLRGNGCLAATHDELLFLMWMPRREIRIPRDHVTSVERTKWHLGKSVFRPLLRVRFTNDQGQPDSVAWLVRDLPMWEAVLAV